MVAEFYASVRLFSCAIKVPESNYFYLIMEKKSSLSPVFTPGFGLEHQVNCYRNS